MCIALLINEFFFSHNLMFIAYKNPFIKGIFISRIQRLIFFMKGGRFIGVYIKEKSH